MTKPNRPVYITGAGAISPLGMNWPDTFQALMAGKSAIKEISRFDLDGFPCSVGASIEQPISNHWLERTSTLNEDRRLLLAQYAAKEAWEQAKPSPHVNGDRIGVFIGTESGRATLDTILTLAQAGGGESQLDHQLFGLQARPFARQFDASAVSPATVTSSLARRIGAYGPAQTISLACASSNASFVEATRAIKMGICDLALCGGVGADIDPMMLAGFGLLGALSPKGISRPFDLKRDGFVVGEGAAMFVLSADPKGAIAKVTGTGRSLDAFHLTKPSPDGSGAKRAMKQALAEAKLDAVQYVQAHGTSTWLNDAAEAKAIQELMGHAFENLHVSSVKGALGHWIAGAGAIGILCAVEAIRSQKVIPTAGLERPDPDCDLPHVMKEGRAAKVESALINSFAFGGANSCVVIQSC